MTPEHLFEPVPPVRYGRRVAPWLTTMAVLGIFLFGFLAFRMHQHTNYDPDNKDSYLHRELKFADAHSTIFRERVAPKLHDAIAGGPVEAHDLQIVSSGGGAMSEEFFRALWASMFADMRPVLDLAFDWNDRAVAALQLDAPARTAALTALRDEDMLSKLQAAEAHAKQGMLAALDSQRLSYRIALWGQWIALVLLLACALLAMWIPDRTLRTIAAEQADYDVAIEEYRAARAAAGDPIPDDLPGPDSGALPPA